MRRALRFAAAVCAAGALGIAVTLPAAGQEATDEATDDSLALPQVYLDGYGWWNKTQQNPIGGQNPSAPVPLPTNCQPTDVNTCPAGPPADGIYVVYDYEAVAPTAVTGPVSNAPTVGVPEQPAESPAPNVAEPQPLGPLAYGAVRFIVPEGAETQLSIPILSRNSTQPGGTDPTVGRLFACISATPGWAAVQNGRYDQAPKYDCSTADEADVAGDSAIFDLSAAFVQNGTLDVVIVGAGDRPFQMALGPPTDSSVMVMNAPETSGSVEEPLPDDYSIEDPLTEFTATDAGVVDSGFAADLSFTPAESVALSPSVPVARPQTRQAVPAGKVFTNPFAPDASRGERMMAVALLLALGAGLWWVGGKPVRAPRLLGSLGGGSDVMEEPVATGGIGRFARQRAGRAPRLF